MTDDRFDNFPFMADKIRVRSTDKGFVVQSNDEAIKRCLLVWCFVELWSPIKTLELVRQFDFLNF